MAFLLPTGAGAGASSFARASAVVAVVAVVVIDGGAFIGWGVIENLRSRN